MAENYLQHAEHYNRIIAAAQAQMPIQNMQNQREASDDDLDEDRDEFETANQGNFAQQPNQGQGNYQGNAGYQGNGGQNGQDNGNAEAAQPRTAGLGSGPQPVIEGMPAEVALNPEAAGEGNSARERNFNGQNNEGREGGRRNRRPRRGERSRPEMTEDGDEPASDGLAATLSRGSAAAPATPSQEPAADDTQRDGDTALVDADN
jgi:hypothetical protein